MRHPPTDPHANLRSILKDGGDDEMPNVRRSELRALMADYDEAVGVAAQLRYHIQNEPTEGWQVARRVTALATAKNVIEKAGR